MLTRELAQPMAHVNERLELTAKRIEAIEIGMRDLIARTDATHI